ncbi:MAG TPA: hypothetical protein VHF22_07765, partial [Planctomycetota bacterium]|nr:hypothetical protein [Planctomycetota bacterium]
MAGVEGVGGKGPSEETKRRLKALGGGAAFQAAAQKPGAPAAPKPAAGRAGSGESTSQRSGG